MKGEPLATAVAEKLGDGYKYLDDDDIGYMYNKDKDDDLDIDEYLHDKAAEILFTEGMAVKMGEYYRSIYATEDNDIPSCVWWNIFTTITPEKILNVWLELPEDEL